MLFFHWCITDYREAAPAPRNISILHRTQSTAWSFWQRRSIVPLWCNGKAKHWQGKLTQAPQFKMNKNPLSEILWGTRRWICHGGGTDSCACTAGLRVLTALPLAALSWTYFHVQWSACSLVMQLLIFLRQLPSTIHLSITIVLKSTRCPPLRSPSRLINKRPDAMTQITMAILFRNWSPNWYETKYAY